MKNYKKNDEDYNGAIKEELQGYEENINPKEYRKNSWERKTAYKDKSKKVWKRKHNIINDIDDDE